MCKRKHSITLIHPYMSLHLSLDQGHEAFSELVPWILPLEWLYVCVWSYNDYALITYSIGSTCIHYINVPINPYMYCLSLHLSLDQGPPWHEAFSVLASWILPLECLYVHVCVQYTGQLQYGKYTLLAWFVTSPSSWWRSTLAQSFLSAAFLDFPSPGALICVYGLIWLCMYYSTLQYSK